MTKIYTLIVGVMMCCTPLAVHGQADWLRDQKNYAGGDTGQAQMLIDTIWVANLLKPNEAIEAIDAMLRENPSLLGMRVEFTGHLRVRAYGPGRFKTAEQYVVRGKKVQGAWEVSGAAAAELVGRKTITPLATAVLTKNTKLVRHLLDFERVHPISRGIASDSACYELRAHDQLLMIAAANGDVPMAKLLIEYGANVNAGDGGDRPLGEYPPLCWAIASHSLAMFKMFVEQGACLSDVAIRAGNAGNPMRFDHDPFDMKSITILGCLITAQANDMLGVALKKISPAEVSGYVNTCVDMASGSPSITPLMLAAAVGNVDAMQRLLQHGADATVKNMQDSGKTALAYAIEHARKKGAMEAIDLLVQEKS